MRYYRDIFDSVDKSLSAKSKRETFLLYSIPVLAFGALSYFGLYEPSKIASAPSLSKLKETRASLQKARETTQGEVAIREEIRGLVAENIKLKEKLKHRKALNDSTEQKLAKLEFTKLNDKNYPEFAAFLTDTAKERGVKIVHMQTGVANKEGGVFTKEMTADINISSDFTKTLLYINDIENSKMFSSVDGVEISGKQELNSSIRVKIKGM